jgi:adenylate cyclase
MLQCSSEDSVYITDCGSSNGTFVNGLRIVAPQELHPGDQIRIGNQLLTFRRHASFTAKAVEAADELQPTNVVFLPSLITVLVADIRGFTQLAQQIDAGKLSQITSTLFREAGKVLQERGAWTQKYIGDAVMAVWRHEKDAPELRELAAIFDAQLRLASIAASLQARFELDAPIRLGAGINTGWASVGNVGSTASSDHTASGDVVNKAFRLETATKELGCDIAIGQCTYEFLAGNPSVDKYLRNCTLQLKGYEISATVYAATLSSLSGLLQALSPNDSS